MNVNHLGIFERRVIGLASYIEVVFLDSACTVLILSADSYSYHIAVHRNREGKSFVIRAEVRCSILRKRVTLLKAAVIIDKVGCVSPSDVVGEIVIGLCIVRLDICAVIIGYILNRIVCGKLCGAVIICYIYPCLYRVLVNKNLICRYACAAVIVGEGSFNTRIVREMVSSHYNLKVRQDIVTVKSLYPQLV